MHVDRRLLPWWLIIGYSLSLRINLDHLRAFTYICVLDFRKLASKRSTLVLRHNNMLHSFHLFCVVMALLLHLQSLNPHMPDLTLLFQQFLLILSFQLFNVMLYRHISILQIIIIFLQLLYFIIFFVYQIWQELVLLLKGSNCVTIEIYLVLGVYYLIINVLGLVLEILVVLLKIGVLTWFFNQFWPKLLDMSKWSLDLLNCTW